MDKYRLVMPPTLFIVLAAPFWKIAHGIIFWNYHAAVVAYCGGILGYVCYDCTHYFLHHQTYVHPISIRIVLNETNHGLVSPRTTNPSRNTIWPITLQITRMALV